MSPLSRDFTGYLSLKKDKILMQFAQRQVLTGSMVFS